MLKVIVLMARREGTCPEEFERHLRERHLPLVARMPGLRRLTVGPVLPDPNGPPAWDAVAEDEFDDPAAVGAALASPAGQAVVADAATFMDMERVRFLVVQPDDVPLPTAAAGEAAD